MAEILKLDDTLHLTEADPRVWAGLRPLIGDGLAATR